eukprot:CAMPEP_0168324958 /NCGR_PEP_ID=MMETSP0213-20121227/4404_1 /TAXON_ID=151035 /ORGANISM="Euplotes harpa, Strain FSP1.4" /LENGTH=114 /DNA_ID=CAMNT_0008327355 /DNA_START=20 /DNA_END=364 /DNA_ORIENTATION=-
MFVSKYLMKSHLQMQMLSFTAARSFSKPTGDIKKLKDKGKGDEERFFQEQEREVLKRLLKKLEAEEANKTQKKEESSSSDDEKNQEGLQDILKKHNIKEDSKLAKDLKEWQKGD